MVETAAIVGVRPETISVWKRHPQWQLEVERWRELAEVPLDRMQLRLQFEAAEATIEALAQLQLIMSSATKRVRTPTGIQEEPDWRTQLKAVRLVLTTAFAAIPQASRVREPGAARPAHASHRALIRTLSSATFWAGGESSVTRRPSSPASSSARSGILP